MGMLGGEQGCGPQAAVLTQEEVFVLVVVGHVFQLLLAILRRKERNSEHQNLVPLPPAHFTHHPSQQRPCLFPVCLYLGPARLAAAHTGVFIGVWVRPLALATQWPMISHLSSADQLKKC